MNSDEQWRALDILLSCLSPEELMLPDTILALLPPQTTGIPREREIFRRRTGDAFDPLMAAENVADMVVRMLLHPERAARLVEQNSRLDLQPSLPQVIDALVKAT